MPVAKDKLEDICEAIGRILPDKDLDDLVDLATGKDVYNSFASPNDARQVRIKKRWRRLRKAARNGCF